MWVVVLPSDHTVDGGSDKIIILHFMNLYPITRPPFHTRSGNTFCRSSPNSVRHRSTRYCAGHVVHVERWPHCNVWPSSGEFNTTHRVSGISVRMRVGRWGAYSRSIMHAYSTSNMHAMRGSSWIILLWFICTCRIALLTLFVKCIKCRVLTKTKSTINIRNTLLNYIIC